MALPKLNNDTPTYEWIIPSTKKSVRFRPFLVKEQKNLLIAMESKDAKQILNSMLSCLDSCVEGINTNDLATFDVDYMFTQIRSKSVGEISEIMTNCANCNHQNKVSVDLSKIDMNAESVKETIIPITDKISVKMKYPTYKDMMENEKLFSDEANVVDVIFETLISCMHSIQTEEENILLKDESKEEIENFVNSLTNEQLDKINAFVDNMPNLSHEEHYKCEECGEDGILELKGLQDFF